MESVYNIMFILPKVLLKFNKYLIDKLSAPKRCLLVGERNLCYQESHVPISRTRPSNIIDDLWKIIEESRIPLVMDLQKDKRAQILELVQLMQRSLESSDWKGRRRTFLAALRSTSYKNCN